MGSKCSSISPASRRAISAASSTRWFNLSHSSSIIVSNSFCCAFPVSLESKLETAVRLGCNFVHLVWRDGYYDMVRIQQHAKYGRETAVALGPVDVVKYAEAFGATGLAIRAADEIGPTLRAALELPGPVLIDVPIDYRDNPKLIQTVRGEAVA